MWRSAILLAAALTGVSLISATAEAQSADPRKGREIFIKKGCWGCHGYNGQGAVTGPRIAPEPMPVEALVAYLRNASATLMPPYDARGLPDADVVHIHAYLASQPKTTDWKTIPLLKE